MTLSTLRRLAMLATEFYVDSLTLTVYVCQ
jgi:hypothetical protein